MAEKALLNVLVTGGAGFLAGAIVRTLHSKHPEWSITVLDLVKPRPEIAKYMHKFIQADVTSSESVDRAFEKYTPDLVIHSAGVVPARALRYSTNDADWQRVKAINYDGTRHVLAAAMAKGCRKFVYTSSVTVVIDDLDHDFYNMDESVQTGLAHLHYGKSKGMAERFVLSPEFAEQGLAACALRPATIIGPGDTAVLGLLHDLIAKGETYFIVGSEDTFYDFVYIDNVVQAHILAAENLLTTQTAAGHAFFISNREPVYFWDFLSFIWAQFGHVPRFRIRVPAGVAWWAGLFMETVTWFTGGNSTIDRGSVKDAVRTHYCSCDKAVEILGYAPTVSLSEGVRRSCDFYKDYLAKKASSK